MKRMAYLYRFNTTNLDMEWTHDQVEVSEGVDLQDAETLAALFYKYFGEANETWKMFAFDASMGDRDDGYVVFTDEYIDSWLRRGIWAPCSSFRVGRISGTTVRKALKAIGWTNKDR